MNMLLQIVEGGSGFCPEKSHESWAASSFYFLFYVARGQGSFFINGEMQTISSYDLFFLPPHTQMRLETGWSELSYYSYTLKGGSLDDFASLLIRASGFSAHLQGGFLQTVFSHLDTLPKDGSAMHRFMAAKYLQDILTECVCLHEKETDRPLSLPQHVLSMKEIFDLQYDTSLTLDDLEARLGMNKYRLCRDFSAQMGISPLQYLNRVRIEKAKELLKNTNQSVRLIGELVGIPNTTHFIKLFQRSNGVTPLRFRMMQRHLY